MQHSSAHIDVLCIASRFQLTRGVRIVEDVMKLRFDEYRESFRDIGFYDAETRAYARTVKESWKLETDSGMLNKDLFVHLYRFPGADEDEMTELAAR
ncbi:MAG: hypothetical protein Q3X15_00840, partial [Sutterella sp.]|nr:hypothetical protein [Sutterella sp.]